MPDRRRLLAGGAIAAAGLGLGLAPGAARADGDWAALAKPGRLAIMRHAVAPGTGDPAEFTLGDCATQRNLDQRGRAQARRLGAEMRRRDIGFDRVLTSRWCRCRETADLLDLGPVEPFPALDSFFGARREDGPEQTRALREFIAGLAAETRVLMVTHFVNIRALTGRATGSGELLVLERTGGGNVRVAGSVIAPD